MLKRLFSLRKETSEFMTLKKQDVPELKSYEWLCDLVFLMDVMSHLNELNLKLQGTGKFFASLYDHVKAFQRKLDLLQTQLLQGNLSHFSACKQLSEEDEHGKHALILLCSKKYNSMLQNIQDEFQRRFCDFRSHEHDLMMFASPFECDPKCVPTEMQLELIELQESSELKSAFRDLSLDKFYSSLPVSTYPALRKHANRMVVLFGSTYICEKTFSVMNFNKSKWRTMLTDEHLSSILRISTSSYQPRYMTTLDEKSQLHSSHKM